MKGTPNLAKRIRIAQIRLPPWHDLFEITQNLADLFQKDLDDFRIADDRLFRQYLHRSCRFRRGRFLGANLVLRSFFFGLGTGTGIEARIQHELVGRIGLTGRARLRPDKRGRTFVGCGVLFLIDAELGEVRLLGGLEVCLISDPLVGGLGVVETLIDDELNRRIGDVAVTDLGDGISIELEFLRTLRGRCALLTHFRSLRTFDLEFLVNLNARACLIVYNPELREVCRYRIVRRSFVIRNHLEGFIDQQRLLRGRNRPSRVRLRDIRCGRIFDVFVIEALIDQKLVRRIHVAAIDGLVRYDRRGLLGASRVRLARLAIVLHRRRRLAREVHADGRRARVCIRSARIAIALFTKLGDVSAQLRDVSAQ